MSKKTYVFVGTYTQPIKFGTGQILQGKGEGIYCYELNTETGEMTLVCENKGIDNPSYLTLDRTGTHLYAVNELKELDGKAQGGVSAFAVDPATKKLTLLNRRGTGGTDPCHVVVNDENTHVYVANFMSGSVCVYPIQSDGSLGEPSQFIQHAGSSVNPKRQLGPHAHSTIFSPDQRFAFVPDLGIDKVMIYKTDFVNGTLTAGSTPFFETAPGSGPRHCEFSEDGKYAYLINELMSSLSALSYHPDGSFELLQTVPTVVGDALPENNICADVHLLPGGKFLYGSNRGHDSIVIYRVDAATGRMDYVDTVSCGGETPRNFCIEPGGNLMVVANQDTDNIVIFRIDRKTGALTKINEVEAPTPVCVKPYLMD